jgi:ketosteroid isomerase-like protein
MRIAPFCLALLASAPLTAQAPGPNAEVLAAAAAFNLAQQQGDRAALERLLAPDFLFVRASGRIGDRREFIAGFTTPGVRFDPLVVTDRLLLRVAPDVVVAGGEALLKGVDNGTALRQHFRYSDTFVRRDGRWMVAFSQVTTLP